MKRAILYIMILMLLVPSFSGCGRKKASRAGEDKIPVRVARIKSEDINKVLEYAGNISGIDEALVYPKVSGKIVEKVKEDGSPIIQDEVIAYIDRDEVGLKFEKAPIESPLTGVVGRVYVDIGSSVTPQTAVALVSNMEKAQINLDIPEKYLPEISIGQTAEIRVDAYPDEIFKGKITKISPVVDVQTRAAPIEIMIDNENRKLQSGMFAKVKLIIGENKNMPILLKEAVIGKSPDTYVYMVEGKKAYLRKVTLGIRQGPYFEVVDGLKDGDLVVIMGQQRLRDGASVLVEE